MPVLKAKMKPAELRKFRTERNLTCQEIADTLGVSRSCYTHWERGEAPISLHAEAAIKNWKIMVEMGKAIIDLDDNGRAEVAIMELPKYIESEIMRYKT
jgi:DNA-binding XRE family transcriptional regulator